MIVRSTEFRYCPAHGRALLTDWHESPAVFLDRDGTIIEEVDYLDNLDDMVLIPRAAQAMAALNQAGWPLVVVTNQSGVARGYFTEEFVHECNRHLTHLLKAANAHIDGVYHCPFLASGKPPYNIESNDRKPAPGMLKRAATDMGLTIAGSYMVGDKISDVETGRELGVLPILVRTGYGREFEPSLPADFAQRGGLVFDDLADAADHILRNTPKK